jgi:hypothetical protein
MLKAEVPLDIDTISLSVGGLRWCAACAVDRDVKGADQ